MWKEKFYSKQEREISETFVSMFMSCSYKTNVVITRSLLLINVTRVFFSCWKELQPVINQKVPLSDEVLRPLFSSGNFVQFITSNND